MKIKTLFGCLLMVCGLTIAANNINNYAAMGGRTIKLAGLIFDLETHKPLSGATITSESGKLLGTTDDRGYFTFNYEYLKKGEIIFRLKIEIDGYARHLQAERWADLKEPIESVYYFGLLEVEVEKNHQVYSRLVSTSNTSYDQVMNGFEDIQDELAFKEKMQTAKAGNKHPVVLVDDNYYLVNRTGWIEIVSLDDYVLIDGDRNVPLSSLNDVVERSAISSMTPVKSKSSAYAITTVQQ